MDTPPKIYSITKNGEHMGIYQEPGNCARAVEGILGHKARGKGNIVPMIAKLGVGKCLDLNAGVKVFRVRPVEEPPRREGVEPQERGEKEPPVEPVEGSDNASDVSQPEDGFDVGEKKAPGQP